MQVAQTGRGGDVVKALAPHVPEDAIGQQSLIGGLAGSEVHVQPAVIVQVAKVSTHGEHGAVQVQGGGHVGKGAVVVVAVQVGHFGIGSVACLEVSNILHGAGRVAGGEDVGPAVVVEVEEPRGKGVVGVAQAGLPGHVGERPMRGVRTAVVAVQAVLAFADGDVDVRPAVVVVVPPCNAFDEALLGKPGLACNVGKGAVGVLVEELGGEVLLRAGVVLVADEQVQPAVIIEVREGCRLCGTRS